MGISKERWGVCGISKVSGVCGISIFGSVGWPAYIFCFRRPGWGLGGISNEMGAVGWNFYFRRSGEG